MTDTSLKTLPAFAVSNYAVSNYWIGWIPGMDIMHEVKNSAGQLVHSVKWKAIWEIYETIVRAFRVLERYQDV